MTDWANFRRGWMLVLPLVGAYLAYEAVWRLNDWLRG